MNTIAYQMLGIYGLFEEDKYTADFGKKTEARWHKGVDEFKHQLHVVLE